MAFDWTYSLGASQWQDYSLYNASIVAASTTVAATRIDYTALDRNTADYLISSDFGAGYFTSFVHDFEALATNYGNTAYFDIWGIANTLHTEDGVAYAGDGNQITLTFYEQAGNTYGYLREYKGNNNLTQDFAATLSQGVNYYIRVIGNENIGAKGQVDAYFYNDAARANLDLHLTVTLASLDLNSGMRYFRTFASWEGDAGEIGTGYIRNLTMRKIPGTEPEDKTFKELRTNINTARATAGLGAYSWTASITDGVNLLASDVTELKTALDDAYDEILICAAHYSSDDATHYTTDKTSHDSADNAAHYSTDDAADDSTVDAADYGTDRTDHDTGHYVTHYGTHKAAYYASRKSWYNSGWKCSSYWKYIKEMKRLKLREEE